MSFYMTVASPSEQSVLDLIEAALYSDFDADYEVVDGNEDDWREIVLRLEDDEGEHEIAIIRRARVDAPDGAELVEALREDAAEGEPASAVRWIHDFLTRVKVLYSFELHTGGREEALEVVRAVWWCILHNTGGIGQVDLEGFTNPEGDHILWQFTGRARASQPWQMALLDDDGRWTTFEMDLANAAHEQAFRAGRVPVGVRPRPSR